MYYRSYFGWPLDDLMSRFHIKTSAESCWHSQRCLSVSKEKIKFLNAKIKIGTMQHFKSWTKKHQNVTYVRHKWTNFWHFILTLTKVWHTVRMSHIWGKEIWPSAKATKNVTYVYHMWHRYVTNSSCDTNLSLSLKCISPPLPLLFYFIATCKDPTPHHMPYLESIRPTHNDMQLSQCVVYTSLSVWN